MSTTPALVFKLDPEDNSKLNNLCGPCNEHLKLIEQYYDVNIANQSHIFTVSGASLPTRQHVFNLLHQLFNDSQQPLTQENLYLMLKDVPITNNANKQEIHTKNKRLTGKTPTQHAFIQALERYTLNFAIGPAGTGKTYLSVAKGVEALESAKVQRLVFVRPAVEAGERLGFLPGDMIDKVLPYLRPIYDALYELLGVERVQKLIQEDSIEIAPLAFMRGRTLNNAFIILDEAQNTTIAQMKMFLTRLGFGSRMVITGDATQTDLPKSTPSGLTHAIKLMKHIDDIHVTHFSAKDVVRHNLVAKIISAYAAHEKKV